MIELNVPIVHGLGGAAQAQFEIGRIQAKAIAASERKLLGEKFALIAIDAPTHAALESIKRELRKIVGESRLDIRQNEICDHLARLPMRERKPKTHPAGATLDG